MFRNIFDIFNLVFWLLIVIIMLMNFPFIKDYVFDKEKVKVKFEQSDSLLVEVDSAESKKSADTVFQKMINFEWKWKDYQSVEHIVKFQLSENDLVNIDKIRANYSNPFFFGTDAGLYKELAKKSKSFVDVLTEKMKTDIKNKEITGYQEIMNYVVSSVQYIPYTLVMNNKECPCKMFGINFKDNCEPLPENNGCCNNIYPFGVFAPAEFLVKKTGDCDTKSLFCYQILKSMGFDVAVLIGSVGVGYHAMLGVATPKPEVRTSYVTHQGKIYYPWEVTGGQSRLGDMRMWPVWQEWKVSIN